MSKDQINAFGKFYVKKVKTVQQTNGIDFRKKTRRKCYRLRTGKIYSGKSAKKVSTARWNLHRKEAKAAESAESRRIRQTEEEALCKWHCLSRTRHNNRTHTNRTNWITVFRPYSECVNCTNVLHAMKVINTLENIIKMSVLGHDDSYFQIQIVWTRR